MFAQNNDVLKDEQAKNWQFMRGLKLLSLSNIKAGDTVLDLGCGTGELTLEIAKKVGPFGRVIGVDCNKKRCGMAQSSIPESSNNITIIAIKGELLKEIESASIDVVFSNNLLHWVCNKTKLLLEINRCLRPNGWIAIEAMGDLMPFLHAITSMTGEKGTKLLNNFHFLGGQDWQFLFERTQFKTSNSNWSLFDHRFDSLELFFAWWEEVTNGMFEKELISPINLIKLEHKYSKGVEFCGSSFQCIAFKNNVLFGS